VEIKELLNFRLYIKILIEISNLIMPSSPAAPLTHEIHQYLYQYLSNYWKLTRDEFDVECSHIVVPVSTVVVVDDDVDVSLILDDVESSPPPPPVVGRAM
jgi:hypothetical protein